MSEPVAREPRRWGGWLIASLCVNFFLLGVIVMGLIVARNRMALTAMNGGGGLRPEVILQSMPPSGAQKMCDVLAAHKENYRRLGEEVVASRNDMFKLFGADALDQAAFQAVIDRQTTAEKAVVQERGATLADLVAKLTSEERLYFTREVTKRFLSLSQPPQGERQSLADICRDIGSAKPQ